MSNTRTLHVTEPHGAQEISLEEDHSNPSNRIYLIKDDTGDGIPLLGSEIDDITRWWAGEKQRPASTETTQETATPKNWGERRGQAIESLQDAIDTLGPITDEAHHSVREPLLDIINLLHEAGGELRDLKL